MTLIVEAFGSVNTSKENIMALLLDKFLSPHTFCALFFVGTVLSGSGASAALINVSVNISQIDGNDLDPALGAGESDWYSKVSINNIEKTSATIDDENDITPSWSFSTSLDARGRTSYDIPIVIQLYDEDVASDDKADISPSGQDLDLTYNLRTRSFTGDVTSSPSTGGDATVYFSITSDPFAFDATFTSSATLIGGGVYLYNYILTNPNSSTFAIDALAIPNLSPFVTNNLLQTPLLPGDPSRQLNFFSDRAPQFAFGNVSYDDLDNTQEAFQLVTPISEPNTLLLLLIGCIGILSSKLSRGFQGNIPR